MGRNNKKQQQFAIDNPSSALKQRAVNMYDDADFGTASEDVAEYAIDMLRVGHSPETIEANLWDKAKELHEPDDDLESFVLAIFDLFPTNMEG